MWKKASAILISTLLAAGIIAFMLYTIWDDLLAAAGHAVWYFLAIASAVCLAAWWLRGSGTGASSLRWGSMSGSIFPSPASS